MRGSELRASVLAYVARSLTATAVVAVAVILSLPATASALRSFAPRPPGGGFVKNTDGTWSLWGESVTKPLRTYTGAEAVGISNETEAIASELAEGSIPGVESLTSGEKAAGQAMAEKLSTGKLYQSAGEQAVGDGIIAEAESAGVMSLPARALQLTGEIGLGVGTAYVGVQVGNSIDRIFGLPTLTLPHAEKLRGPNTGLASFSYIEQTKLEKLPVECSTVAEGHVPQPAGDKCSYYTVHVKYIEEDYQPGCECWELKPEHANDEFSSRGGSPAFPVLPGYTYYDHVEPSGIQTLVMAVDVSKLLDKAFPMKHLKEALDAHHEAENRGNGALTSPPGVAVPAEITPPAPSEVAAPPATFVAHERESEFPGVEDEREEALPIPNPLYIEIPTPEPLEVGTHYVTRLHELGFTNVVEATLPAFNTDPHVGPNEVSYTSPAEGTRVAPDTTVTVEVNPSDAPVPPGAGGFGANIPALKLPKFGGVCKNFPFGVPCWLIETFSAWSGTAVTPNFTMGPWKIRGTTIGPATVNLESLEPVMEKVRPFMVLFATIGLVLLFYNFARGGGPPSGSQGDTTEDEGE